ncbi:DUF1640 domain-containing protein [Helicobacter sp. 13S00482-2]|uniref:DUF1640 domain-containing protein n=1 Tax=Helicobacter sp. 13S00482-2 TaxID=1476200 RepID=UPI000BA6A66D|nr:DUF1640 domain-containing protein [Helicobacter sp. 13S00482-2]
MVQYTQNSKGEMMLYGSRIQGMTEEVYNIIYNTFPDKNQANGVVSAFEKVLLELDIKNKNAFDEKLDMIVFRVKEKLGEEFATKADLRAAFLELELKIAQSELKLTNMIKAESEKVRTELKQDIAEVRTELKQDIADVKTELKQDIADVKTELKQDIADVKTELKQDIAKVGTELRQAIKETISQSFDDKLKSFKYSIIGWFVGIAIAAIGAIGTIIKMF